MRHEAGVRRGRVRGVHRDGLPRGPGQRQGGAPQRQRVPRPRGQHARYMLEVSTNFRGIFIVFVELLVACPC